MTLLLRVFKSYYNLIFDSVKVPERTSHDLFMM